MDTFGPLEYSFRLQRELERASKGWVSQSFFSRQNRTDTLASQKLCPPNQSTLQYTNIAIEEVAIDGEFSS